jgi:hypothetical protein
MLEKTFPRLEPWRPQIRKIPHHCSCEQSVGTCIARRVLRRGKIRITTNLPSHSEAGTCVVIQEPPAFQAKGWPKRKDRPRVLWAQKPVDTLRNVCHRLCSNLERQKCSPTTASSLSLPLAETTTNILIPVSSGMLGTSSQLRGLCRRYVIITTVVEAS